MICMSVCSSQSHNLCSKSVLCFLSCALVTCCRNSLAHLAPLAGPYIYREGLSGWTPRRAPICVKHVLPLHSDSTGLNFPTETKSWCAQMLPGLARVDISGLMAEELPASCTSLAIEILSPWICSATPWCHDNPQLMSDRNLETLLCHGAISMSQESDPFRSLCLTLPASLLKRITHTRRLR
jgi:hypothetical protein